MEAISYDFPPDQKNLNNIIIIWKQINIKILIMSKYSNTNTVYFVQGFEIEK